MSAHANPSTFTCPHRVERGTVTTRRTRISAIAVLAAALALLAAGCGEKSETLAGAPQPFDVGLDFYPNADHAGIYEGLRKGFFGAAGLTVKPRSPSDPSAPIKQVAAGRLDLAISYEPEVLLARDRGLDVVTVGALVHQPLTSLISLGKANIKTVADLKGKTVATAGIPYQASYLDTILKTHGVQPSDVKQIDVGEGLLPAVLSGKADAMLGGFVNVEGVDLRLRDKNPRVVPVNQLGVPTYDELVLVAQGKRLADDPESIRLFIAALARGTRAAAKDPKGVTAALLKAEPSLDPKLTLAEVKQTLPLLQPRPGRPFGYLDRHQWQQFAGWMTDNGLISRLPNVSQAITNKYLPGAVTG